MIFFAKYASPLGEMTLAGDGENLVGAWFDGQKFFGEPVGREMCSGGVTEVENAAIFQKTREWLDAYFRGEKPTATALTLALLGNEFQRTVWEILLEIPYGEMTTYGAVAEEIAVRLGRSGMSAQAAGGAIGRNPASVIVPCHRVLGAGGKLTGYAGGIERKLALLRLEGALPKICGDS